MKYIDAFEIAKTVRRVNRRKFRDGVERAAALAAVVATSKEELVDKMEIEFYRYEDRSPRWDGSIA